jgi:hypothetical protein
MMVGVGAGAAGAGVSGVSGEGGTRRNDRSWLKHPPHSLPLSYSLILTHAHSCSQVFRSTYAEGGVAAMFVGTPARVAWLLPFTTIYLQAYELLKKRVVAYKKDKLRGECERQNGNIMHIRKTSTGASASARMEI